MQCGILLAGCGIGGIVPGGHDLPPETGDLQGDWPRLVDAPPPAEPGVGGAPDPADGAEIRRALATEAAVSAATAQRLAQPVIPEAEARRLAAAAR